MTKHPFLAALFVVAASVAAGSGCALFAPSKAELMSYCVSDPDVKHRAAQLGMSPEAFCEKLLRDEPEAAAGACDGGDSGSCELR